jgi:hypothetical protein
MTLFRVRHWTPAQRDDLSDYGNHLRNVFQEIIAFQVIIFRDQIPAVIVHVCVGTRYYASLLSSSFELTLLSYHVTVNACFQKPALLYNLARHLFDGESRGRAVPAMHVSEYLTRSHYCIGIIYALVDLDLDLLHSKSCDSRKVPR